MKKYNVIHSRFELPLSPSFCIARAFPEQDDPLIQKGRSMKRIIAMAAALAAIVIFAQGNAQAQTTLHPGGFPFPGMSACGGGFGFGGGIGFGGFPLQLDREQPPYFAKFPPVYYSHAVKRPYGVSPYAAPAGVVPVEMSHPLPSVDPVLIENPHFTKGSSELKAQPKTDQQVSVKKDKIVGWQANPFFNAGGLALN